MKFTVPNPSIEIELSDEKTPKPAEFKVVKEGETLAIVQAVIEREEDPERGFLNVVKFRRIK